jgi:hypothetical protein
VDDHDLAMDMDLPFYIIPQEAKENKERKKKKNTLTYT